MSFKTTLSVTGPMLSSDGGFCHCFWYYVQILYLTLHLFFPPRRHSVEKVKLPLTGQPGCASRPMKPCVLNVALQLSHSREHSKEHRDFNYAGYSPAQTLSPPQ